MKRKIIVSWPGFTGYMGACWQALARVADVRIFIEPSPLEQQFDCSDLAGLAWTRVEGPAAIADAIRAAQAFAPDLVLVCGWSTPLSRAFAQAPFVAARKVLAFDMPWEWRIRKILARWALHPRLRHFDAAFVPGRCTARYARWLGFGAHVVMGSNPSGWERFSRVKPGPRGFAFVGRFAQVKGIDVLLKAYALYRTRTASPWPLELIGSGDLPGFVFGEGVRVRGFVSPEDLPSALSETACLVLPSRWEPWGVSAAEAMSAGLATILSAACGLVSDVSPTRVVRPGDIAGLAKAMLAVERLSAADRAAESARVRPLMAKYSAADWAARVLKFVRAEIRREGR